MKINHQSIKIPRSAHYYKTGPEPEKVKTVWLVCHGYGQSAQRFIKKFHFLDHEAHLILAPEGLSRFYWNDVKGEVVASWMTKKDRLGEIEDHTQFLNQVLKRELPERKCPLFLFGFSQGTATIMRFIEKYQPSFKFIFVWAGKLPRDVDYESLQGYFKGKQLHYFFGDQDQYITPDLLNEEIAFIQNLPLDTFIHPFSGEHRVYPDILKKVLVQESIIPTFS